MTKKLMAVGLITILGFLLGVVANLLYVNALPVLSAALPQLLALLNGSWLLWGIIGALVFIGASLLYAFFPEDNTRKALVLIVVCLAIVDVILIVSASTL